MTNEPSLVPQLRLVLLSVFSLTLTVAGPVTSLQAQATPPEPLAQGLSPLNEVQVFTLPAVDAGGLLENESARARRAQEGGIAVPRQFAVALLAGVELTPQEVGQWERGENGEKEVWRIRFTSEGAKSLNFGFTRFRMPPGGELYVYTSAYDHIVGPFTSADNEDHGQLWTPPLSGNDAVIEISVPVGEVENLELGIGAVNGGFRDVPRPKKQGDCNIDVVCEEGDEFRDVIRSVAALSIRGRLSCSGALLNNTAEDRKPYLLTAFHCEIGESDAPSVVVFWNFESEECGDLSGGAQEDYQTGAYLRAAWEDTDFLLLELDDVPKKEFNVYLAGWNRSPDEADFAIGIHHPDGDEKAISLALKPTMTTSAYGAQMPGDGSHIRIQGWDYGTTESGSSGSPLFDQDKLVIGQLHGGWAACGNGRPDWYGRLSRSWTGGGSADRRLRDWLDPESNGVAALEGMELNEEGMVLGE